jgi:hypothetical protein
MQAPPPPRPPSTHAEPVDNEDRDEESDAEDSDSDQDQSAEESDETTNNPPAWEYWDIEYLKPAQLSDLTAKIAVWDNKKRVDFLTQLAPLLKYSSDAGRKNCEAARDATLVAMQLPDEFLQATVSTAKEAMKEALDDQAYAELAACEDEFQNAPFGASPTTAGLEKQLSVARKLTTRYCEKLGIPVVEIVQQPHPNRQNNGQYSPTSGRVEINSNCIGMLSQADLVKTVMHEVTHYYQHCLAKSSAGLMQANMPNAATGEVFAVQFLLEGMYVDSPPSLPPNPTAEQKQQDARQRSVHEQQPAERQTYALHNEIGKEFRAELRKHRPPKQQ